MNNPPSGKVYVPERSRRDGVCRRTIHRLRGPLAQIPGVLALAWAITLVAPLGTFAQGSFVPARVTDRVDLSQLTTLTGNTHPLAQPQYDQGAAPADLPMNRILLILKRSPDQEAALQSLLVQQQVTSSPTFRQWLTPDQFGQQFGLADADLQAVTSWLASFGFQSIQAYKSRNFIEFSGTAAQVQAALHTQIHQYVVDGESHWANASDPQVPTALAPVISGVVSLHTFRAKPTIMRTDRKLAANVAPGGRPQITLCTVNQTPCPAADVLHALVPADFNTIYNIGSTMTGSGETIGIIANTNININDVIDFWSRWTVRSDSPTVVLNGPDPGDVPGSADEGEAVLDTTWAGAVAPLATVKLVVSEDTNATFGIDLSEIYIIDNNLADVMTESFESCESQFGSSLSSQATAYSLLAEQAAAQGISYAVATGDGGPDACDDPSTFPSPPTAASVNILAATPFTLAVGGTMFHEGSTPSTYWSTNSNQTTGESALSYIPEDAWNEACAELSSTCAVVGIWSSGGGISSIFSKPSWQAGVTGLPSTTFRSLPDVAMTAAGHDGYVLCIDGSCPQEFGIASGTSAAVQVFGGVMALVDQQMGGRVGLPNYALYKLAAGETFSSCNASGTPALVNGADNCIFNDVTVGNTNLPTTPAETGFSAGVGYDLTTGLGSVNVSNLVNKWHTAIVDNSTTTLTLNGGSAVNGVTHGASIPVSITVSPVSPATGAPTGDVSLIAVNTSTGAQMGITSFSLTPGTTSSSVSSSTTLLPGGTWQVHAHYGGSGTFLGSDSTATAITVDPQASQISSGIVVNNGITGCTASSVVYGSPYVLTAVVSPSGIVSTPCNPNEAPPRASGTVTLTDSFNGGTAAPLDGGTFTLNSVGYFEDQTIQLPAGSHAISASYAGDASFSASGPVSNTITVTPAATSTAVSASQTSVSAGTSVTLTATVSTQSNATANSSQEPNGSVQFLLNGSNFGGGPVAVTGGVNQTTMFAQATASMSTSSLAAGANVITAKYLGDIGDTNYAASAASPSVTVTVTGPSVTTTTLPTGVLNTAYPSTQLAATGGATPYTWSITTGSLPTGFPQLPSTGIISGTPTATGTFNFTVQVKDSLGNTNTAALSITINATGISLSASNSGQIPAIPPGQQGTDTITVTGSGGFTGTVALTVSGPTPSNLSDPPSCSFGSTGNVALSSTTTSGTGTLTCSTTAASALFKPGNRWQNPNRILLGEGAVAIACLFLLGMAGQKRRGIAILTLLLVVVVLGGISCGGSSSGGGGGNSNPGTAAQAYTFTVTGTPPNGSGAAVQTATVTLTVQ